MRHKFRSLPDSKYFVRNSTKPEPAPTKPTRRRPAQAPRPVMMPRQTLTIILAGDKPPLDTDGYPCFPTFFEVSHRKTFHLTNPAENSPIMSDNTPSFNFDYSQAPTGANPSINGKMRDLLPTLPAPPAAPLPSDGMIPGPENAAQWNGVAEVSRITK